MLTQLDFLNAQARAGYLRGQWSLPKDASYSPLSVAFVELALREWVKSLPPELVEMRDIGGGKTIPMVRWEEESGDCDNIAWDFIAFLNRCLWLDAVKSGIKRGNTAAGTFFFQTIPGNVNSGHAIVWFIDHSGLGHHVDPAIFRVDHLSAEQLATIWGGEYA